MTATDRAESLERTLAEVRAAHAPDARMAVFDIDVESTDTGALRLTGSTTVAPAVDELLARLGALNGGVEVRDEVVRLPDPALGPATHALVRAAVAPLYAEPILTAAHLSQRVLGARLEILARRRAWWCVRGDDGYIAWVHHGFVETGDSAWADAWERGGEGEPVVSLGADLVDDAGDRLAQLPWGARLVRDARDSYATPGDVRGRVRGEVVPAAELAERFPADGEAVVETAARWMATPYLWGGVTPAGADCSGFVQAVYRLHGVLLPRDSDQQSAVGDEVEVDPEGDYERLRAGDLLFFAETPERVSHVAISLGGSRILHSALSNGGVRTNDLAGDASNERLLRRIFVVARRVLAP